MALVCHGYKEYRKEVSSTTESGSSTSTAAANHQIEAEVANQDKQRRKSSKYNHYDVDEHADIAKSAYEKTLSLMDVKLGIMYKTLTIWAAKTHV